MVNLVKPYAQMTPVLSKRIALFVIHQVQLIDLLFQWIGWRDNLQETIVFTCLCQEILINLVVYCKCSHNSVQWLCLDCWLDSTHWSSICVLHATAFSSSLQAATSSPGASLFDEPPTQVVIINPWGHGGLMWVKRCHVYHPPGPFFFLVEHGGTEIMPSHGWFISPCWACFRMIDHNWSVTADHLRSNWLYWYRKKKQKKTCGFVWK